MQPIFLVYTLNSRINKILKGVLYEAQVLNVNGWGPIVQLLTATIFPIFSRKAKAIKHTSPLPMSSGRIEHKDSSTLRAYPSIAAITAADAHNGSFGNGAVRNHPNGLVTFSSNPQPIYANVGNGKGHTNHMVDNDADEDTNIQTNGIRQLRNGVIQSESL